MDANEKLQMHRFSNGISMHIFAITYNNSLLEQNLNKFSL